ncbi:nucleotidyl transferase family protein [Mycobacterium xenopi 4042]|uniref:Nucleotidyl transferase family protein n=1 Tax=Mycobacterium xenopi 4042 TaxID=1299334 RepID=X8E0K1_MYCXE|nr:nucleotidyl transferase family protein [Mycobacterium xenopi 4042]
MIDFVLSNLVNARYLRICVLTQYKSHSLDRHISQNWRLSGLPVNTSLRSLRSSDSAHAGTPAPPTRSISR